MMRTAEKKSGNIGDPVAKNALYALNYGVVETKVKFFSSGIDYFMKHMNKFSLGGAFSTGIGLAMGLVVAQYAFQAIGVPGKTTRQVIICLRCDSKNPAENKFCGQCGQALYPLPPINCPRCMAVISSKMKFCGRCGSSLK
jgi:membrane protease subunit (stomatin/prohibitin family)